NRAATGRGHAEAACTRVTQRRLGRAPARRGLPAGCPPTGRWLPAGCPPTARRTPAGTCCLGKQTWMRAHRYGIYDGREPSRGAESAGSMTLQHPSQSRRYRKDRWRRSMTYAGDLTPQQAWEYLNNTPGAVLVDVRTKAEWSFV